MNDEAKKIIYKAVENGGRLRAWNHLVQGDRTSFSEDERKIIDEAIREGEEEVANFIREIEKDSEGVKRRLEAEGIKFVEEKSSDVQNMESKPEPKVVGENQEVRNNVMTVSSKTNIFEKMKTLLFKDSDVIKKTIAKVKENMIKPVKEDKFHISKQTKESGKEEEKNKDFSERYHADVPGISPEHLEEIEQGITRATTQEDTIEKSI